MARTSPGTGATETGAVSLLATPRAPSLTEGNAVKRGSAKRRMPSHQFKGVYKGVKNRDYLVHYVDWFDRVVRGESFGVDVLADMVQGLDSRRARTFLGSFNEVSKPTLLSTLGISQRTLDRAIEKKSSLSIDVTDRLTRLAETRATANRIFSDSKVAERWLLQPLAWLGGNSPIELLKTSTGTELVKEYLERIDRGVYA